MYKGGFMRAQDRAFIEPLFCLNGPPHIACFCESTEQILLHFFHNSIIIETIVSDIAEIIIRDTLVHKYCSMFIAQEEPRQR